MATDLSKPDGMEDSIEVNHSPALSPGSDNLLRTRTVPIVTEPAPVRSETLRRSTRERCKPHRFRDE